MGCFIAVKFLDRDSIGMAWLDLYSKTISLNANVLIDNFIRHLMLGMNFNSKTKAQ